VLTRPLGLLLCLFVAGCDAGLDTRGIRTLSVLDGAVSVRGPEGFCVDQQSSRAGSGFAVLAGCAVVSDATIMPAREALMTVQIGAAASAAVAGAEADLADLLRSGQGAALLSATGSSATVRIDRVDRAEGVVVVRFSDQAPAAIAGLEPVEWRAFLDIRGRLTTISLRGFARAPLPAEQGLRLLSQAIGAMRQANAAATPPTN
jgi:hypothetical protein